MFLVKQPNKVVLKSHIRNDVFTPYFNLIFNTNSLIIKIRNYKQQNFVHVNFKYIQTSGTYNLFLLQ